MTELKTRPGDQVLPTPNDRPDIQSLVIADIQERRQVGIARYGTPLQPFNGRDSLRDLYEELLDAAIYTRQLLEEQNLAQPELCEACQSALIVQVVELVRDGRAIRTLTCEPCGGRLCRQAASGGDSALTVRRFTLTPIEGASV